MNATDAATLRAECKARARDRDLLDRREEYGIFFPPLGRECYMAFNVAVIEESGDGNARNGRAPNGSLTAENAEVIEVRLRVPGNRRRRSRRIRTH